jgi:membrane peptidoglycan carboxypeptidase
MLPIFSIFSGDTKNPKETALIQQRLEEAHDQEKKLQIDYRWVLLGNLPQTVRRDVLIAKDARFYSPAGIDWHEVWK